LIAAATSRAARTLHGTGTASEPSATARAPIGPIAAAALTARTASAGRAAMGASQAPA